MLIIQAVQVPYAWDAREWCCGFHLKMVEFGLCWLDKFYVYLCIKYLYHMYIYDVFVSLLHSVCYNLVLQNEVYFLVFLMIC